MTCAIHEGVRGACVTCARVHDELRDEIAALGPAYRRRVALSLTFAEFARKQHAATRRPVFGRRITEPSAWRGRET